MKLFRRIFLLSMLLSSTLFFLQCSTCKKKVEPTPDTEKPFTSIEQIVGAPKAWKISEALEDGTAIALATPGSITLSFTKEGSGETATAKSFTTNIVAGVPSPTGTATTGAYSITASQITFSPGTPAQSIVNYTMTPTGGREFATRLVVEFEFTADPAKPKKKYKYTYTR